jgi:hypothetical protein
MIQSQQLLKRSNMSKLQEMYDNSANASSDINEHLPVLYKYAKECSTIIEMGTRDGSSIYAFALAQPKSLVSMDLGPFNNSGVLKEALAEVGTEYEHKMASTLEIEIPEVELLFIDTEHSYLQLKAELARHGNKATKYLIFHDTNTFGYVDSDSYGDQGLRPDGPEVKHGLVPALDDFLEANPHWVRHEVLENNNGLTILKRK